MDWDKIIHLRGHEGDDAPQTPDISRSNVALSEAMGWGLIRTQTLADGCPHCDFRFKKEGKTQISSETPEVEETIERIWNKEAGLSARGGADTPGA